MPERRQLGAILLESGRIQQEDVQRILDYQRTHGGFFGQAVVALGLVTREEIDWALASQFDLPFIFPNADAVDREAAQLVPADWALAHLAVPIVRAGRTITLVVAEPLAGDVLDELRTRTGCDVELALASAVRIRELIHALYDTAQLFAEEEEPRSFDEFVANALEHGADRFGVSIRGTAAAGWWRTQAGGHRMPLSDGWEMPLDNSFDPAPLEQLGGAGDGRVEFETTMHRHGATTRFHAQLLAGAGGVELLLRPHQKLSPARAAAGIVLPSSLVTELRLLWRSGTARVGVGAAQIEVARLVLPTLPALVFGHAIRCAHISESGEGTTYTLRAERGESFAAAVSAYEFDALTVDLPAEGYAVRTLLRAAPLTFMLLDEPEERAAPGDWGLNWLLTISGQPGSFAWDLRALHR